MDLTLIPDTIKSDDKAKYIVSIIVNSLNLNMLLQFLNKNADIILRKLKESINNFVKPIIQHIDNRKQFSNKLFVAY